MHDQRQVESRPSEQLQNGNHLQQRSQTQIRTQAHQMQQSHELNRQHQQKYHHPTLTFEPTKSNSVWLTMLDDLYRVCLSPCCFIPLPNKVHQYLHRSKVSEPVRSAETQALEQQPLPFILSAALDVPSTIEEQRNKASERDEIAKTLSDKQVLQCHKIFRYYDPDSDGVINNTDLANVMRQLGHNPTEAEVREMIHEAGATKTGNIDFPDFLALVARKLKDTEAEEEIRNAFSLFDKNCDGCITKEELLHILTDMGSAMSLEDAEELVAYADTDGGGLISYDDFIKRLMSD